MAQTSKTLELRIKSTSDGDQVLDQVNKKVKGIGVSIEGLTSIYKKNEEGVMAWSHSLQLAAKDIEKLRKAQNALSTGSFQGVDQVSVTQKPVKEHDQNRKAIIKEEKALSEALLSEVKRRVKEEESAEKEKTSTLSSLRKQQKDQYSSLLKEEIALRKALLEEVKRSIKEEEQAEKDAGKRLLERRKQQAEQLKQLTASRDARKGNYLNQNKELLAASNRAIELEKLKVSKGADDIAVIRERLAQKQRKIAEQVQKDLVSLAEKGANGEVKNVVAARTKILAAYRKSMLDIHKELAKANKNKAIDDSVARQNKAIQEAKRKMLNQQKLLNSGYDKTIQKYRQINSGVRSVIRSHRHWSVQIAEGIGLYRAVSFAIHSISQAILAIPKIGIELQTTKAVFESVLGGGGGAAAAFKLLDKEAQRTGISIGILRENFRNLVASMTLAGESTDTAVKVFTNLNTVSTALHLTTDKTRLVFLAFSQIFNKSKVQAEELVKQLGNLLPGAFASFQKANEDMFSSTQDLVKKMSEGTVFAHRTIVKFTDYLARRFKAGFGIAVDGLQANLGRLSTSATHLGEAIFKDVNNPLTDLIKLLTKTTDVLTMMVESVGNITLIFKTGLTIALSLVAGKLFSLAKGLLTYNKTVITATGITHVYEVGLSALVIRLRAAAAAMLAFAKTPQGIIAGLAIAALGLSEYEKQSTATEDAIREATRARLDLDREAKLSSAETLDVVIANSEQVIRYKKLLKEEMKKKQDLVDLKNNPLYNFFNPVGAAKLEKDIKQADNLIKQQQKNLNEEIKRETEAFNLQQQEQKKAASAAELARIKKQNEDFISTLKIRYDGIKELENANIGFERTKLTLEENLLKDSLDRKEISITEYYTRKKELALKDLELQKQLFVLENGPISKGSNFNIEAYGAGLKKFDILEKILTNRIDSEKRLATTKKASATSSTKEVDTLKMQMQLEAEVLALKSRSFEATKREIEIKRAETLKQVKGIKTKGADKVRELANQRASLAASQNLYNDRLKEREQILSSLSSYEEVVKAKEQAGLVNRLQAFDLIQKRREQALVSLKEYITIQEDLIDAQKRVAGEDAAPELTKNVQEARRQYELLRLTMIKGAKDANKEINVLGVNIRNDLESSLGNAFAGFIRGTKSATQAMADFANSVLDSIAIIASNKLAEQIIGLGASLLGSTNGGGIVEGGGNLSGQIGSYLSVNAKGNVYDQSGKVTAFAKGGIVNKPTVFKFAKGTGLMGEAGAEAILPLKRTSSGDLGVQATVNGGQSGVVIQQLIVNVEQKEDETSQEQSEQIGKAIRKQLESMIDTKLSLSKRPGGIMNPTQMQASF